MANICKATKMIEDGCCRMPFRCERGANHKGKHKTTYPGEWGGENTPVEWTKKVDKTAIKFHK